MDSYLKGLDIHEFLTSIGKHAVEKVTSGSFEMRTVKPKCSNIVFVEDTDELAHFDNGCGIGDKEDKGFTFGGWPENMQKDNSSGWGAKKKVTTHECKENLQMEDNSGWGEEIEVTPSGWEASTQKENKSGWERKEDSPGGWDMSAHQEDNAGWGEEKMVAPAGWGKGKQREESCTGWGSSTQKEGNSGWEEEIEVTPSGWESSAQKEDKSGWETKENTPGGWDKNTDQEDNAGWGEEKKVAPAGRGQGKQREESCIRWGRSTQKEGNAGWGHKKHVTACRGGENKVAPGVWGKGAQHEDNAGWEDEKYVARGGRGKGTKEERTSTRWRSCIIQDGWGEEKGVSDDGWGEEKNVASGGWGRGSQKQDTCIGWGSGNAGFGEEREVTTGGWEEKREVVSARWGKGIQKEDGWGSSTHRKGIAGWGETNAVTVDGRGKEEKVSTGGWGKDVWEKDTCIESSTQGAGCKEENEVTAGGWGKENDVALDGWSKGALEITHSGGGSSTQKEGAAGWEEAKEVTADGWGQSTQQKVDDGWGEEKEVTAGGWGEEKGVAPGGWGKGAQDKTRGGGGSSTQKEGAAGWEEAKQVTADGWGQSTQQKVDDGWGEVEDDSYITRGWGENTQKAKEVTADGRGQSTQKKVDDGWGEMEDDSHITRGRGENTQKEDNSGWGLVQDVPTRNRDVLPNSDWAKADDPPLDGRRGGKQVVTGDNNGWDRPFKTDTQKIDSADGWDSMQGQNPRNRPKKGWSTRPLDPLVSTESHGANERRSGTFGPSGTNTVPLGKRKSFLKATNGNAEKGHGQSDWAPQLERGSDSMNQFVASDSLGRRIGKSVPESETPNANVSSMRMESEEDGWANSEQSRPLRNRSLGRRDLNSKTDHEALADSNGWGSELPISNNSQVDGWNDMNPDTQGETSRPNKRFNRCFTGNSWTGPASNGPHNQNRWPRLKALIILPEYSELGELYKATNKILHYNGYQPGDKLNPEDEKFVLEKILIHHRDKEAKLGCGVEYVMIDSHSDHQVSCFWVVRKDGSKTDFSYWKCLENLFEMKYPHVEMEEVHKAGKDGWGTGTKSAAPFRRRHHPQEADREEAKDGWQEAKADREEAKAGWQEDGW